MKQVSTRMPHSLHGSAVGKKKKKQRLRKTQASTKPTHESKLGYYRVPENQRMFTIHSVSDMYSSSKEIVLRIQDSEQNVHVKQHFNLSSIVNLTCEMKERLCCKISGLLPNVERIFKHTFHDRKVAGKVGGAYLKPVYRVKSHIQIKTHYVDDYIYIEGIFRMKAK